MFCSLACNCQRCATLALIKKALEHTYHIPGEYQGHTHTHTHTHTCCCNLHTHTHTHTRDIRHIHTRTNTYRYRYMYTHLVYTRHKDRAQICSLQIWFLVLVFLYDARLQQNAAKNIFGEECVAFSAIDGYKRKATIHGYNTHFYPDACGWESRFQGKLQKMFRKTYMGPQHLLFPQPMANARHELLARQNRDKRRQPRRP